MLPLQAKKEKTIEIKVLETTDVHGMFFPTNFMTGAPAEGTLARVSSYVKKQREKYGQKLILLENGDLLQGQPTNYIWNYVDTNERNIAADIVNYMGYNAQNFGNHDVETGHPAYDKWTKELNCPVLGANITDTKTGQPYVTPYIILEREGVKIAILGLITPAIPNWLSEDIWQGLHFEELTSAASRWVKIIKDKEKPDVMIGLFHSGRQGGISTPEYTENASQKVAEQVPGFDIIFFGHDHVLCCEKVKNSANETVHLIDAANQARSVGEATIRLQLKGKKVVSKEITSALIPMKNEPIDEDFMKHFEKQLARIKAFTSEKIGSIGDTIYTQDSFFGSSALSDLIHNLQLSITGSDISFNAPLKMTGTINKGDLTMADMFNLYKYENKIYVMKMRGSEIKNYLEMSYDMWTNQMSSPDDHIILFSEESLKSGKPMFKNTYFNFDTAAGIDYTVDVTKPNGSKVSILRMSNGQPFSEDAWYKVTVNSYRANGGGELITLGAGIPKEEIESRIIYRSTLDQRSAIIEAIKKMGHISPKPNNNWRFIPEDWAKPALARDRQLLFPKKK